MSGGTNGNEPNIPKPPSVPIPKPKAAPGRFWSLLVGLSLTAGFTFGAVLAWLP